MLLSSSSVVTDEDFVFLSDDIDLGDAEVSLLQSSLIDKHIENQYLSMHRLVQQAVLQKTPKLERVKYADVAVQILQQMVPGSGSDVTDFLKAWTAERWVLHEKCLPHLLQLVRHCRQYDIRPSNIKAMIALLLPCEIFVREREMFDIAEELIQAGLWFVESDKIGLDYAGLSYRLGLVKLYTHRLEEAIGHFQEGLRLREGLLGPDHALVAWGYNNIGLTFTELGRQKDALYYLETALKKRRTHDPSCVGNSLSNLASLSLQMGLPDQAEQHLFSCPSLQGLTDDLLLEKNNPRFAGDMVLLSRIRRAQGRSDDALRLASKALAYRQKLLGNRFTACDSMHDVALLLIEHEKYEMASSILQELLSIAKSSLGHHGRGQLARACYRLSALHAHLGETAVSQQYKDSAMDLARELVPVGRPITFGEETFSSLCPWMLW